MYSAGWTSDPPLPSAFVRSDPAKIAALRESGAAQQAEREKKAAEMAAVLARMKSKKQSA